MNNGYDQIYKEANTNKFWEFFENLKINYEFLGHWYTKDVIDYFFVRARDSGFIIKDHSCIFIFNGKPYSVFLGAQFIKDGSSILNLFEIPCLVFDELFIPPKGKKQIKLFAENLFTNEFNNFQLKGPELDSNIPIFCEFLLSKNISKIKPNTTRIIDLKLSESQLKRSIRKSYHSLVNWGLNNLKIDIHDKSNIKWEIIEKFRQLHIKESKRETRSINTWRKQFDAISNGDAFCITAYFEEEFVSAAYFICPDKICYYASSVSKRDLFDKPINHAIIWCAILECKRKGVFLFNIGSTYESKSDNLSSKKEKNIAYFKEGFGGKLVLNYVIENL